MIDRCFNPNHNLNPNPRSPMFHQCFQSPMFQIYRSFNPNPNPKSLMFHQCFKDLTDVSLLILV